MGIKIGPSKGGSTTKTSSAAGGVEWESAPSEFTTRTAFVSVYGATSTGKTSAALTAPDPIALLHFAEEIDGVIQPFVQGGKDIRMANFSGAYMGTQEQVAKAAGGVWDQFKDAVEDALGWARTIVWDTHTDAWELLRLARFGKLSQIKPIHYGVVNAEWKNLITSIKQSGINFVAVGKEREQYLNDKPTGVLEMAGQKEMAYMSNVVLYMTCEDGTFTATIEKPWFNAPLMFEEFIDESIDFAQMLGIITETDPEEWV